MTDGPIMDAVDAYYDAEAYIKGEYGEELPIIARIIGRHNQAVYDPEGDLIAIIHNVEALVLDIVGYYTGCLNPDGSARVKGGRTPPKGV